MIITMFRIFEEKNGRPCTLFHGINGSRYLPLDEWIESENKEVWDGVKSRAKKYLSGFHVMDSIESLKEFLWRFKHLESRVICPVQVDIDAGIWNKEHSSKHVKLVKKMRITNEDWERRIPCLESLN